MDDNIRELYQEIILEHSRCPRNFKEIEKPTSCAKGHNVICGDKLIVYLKLSKNLKVENISFKGVGCAICIASASLMTEAINGKTLKETKEIFQKFHNMLTKECNFECENITDQKLSVFCNVKNYPIRVKCATLAWHTLMQAIKNNKSLDSPKKS